MTLEEEPQSGECLAGDGNVEPTGGVRRTDDGDGSLVDPVVDPDNGDRKPSRRRRSIRMGLGLSLVLFTTVLAGTASLGASRLPWCVDPASDFIGDPAGDGYGWENHRSCVVQGGRKPPSPPGPPTTQAAVGPPTTAVPVTTTVGPATTVPAIPAAPSTMMARGTMATTPAAPMTSMAPMAPDAGGVHAGHVMAGGDSNMFEAIRNAQSKFTQFENVSSSALSLDTLTIAAPRPDNGSVGDGQFRTACEYSHLNYDDPIVFPGQPGKAHLHLFFGNTRTNAMTTTDSLVNSGGGSCDGFELNRSAYWTPALLDGKGNVIVPDDIIIYYKTKVPGATQPMPQGLKMLAGNTSGGSFNANQFLEWTCGGSGVARNPTNHIPDCGGDLINATIMFPNCWDGANLDSADHKSHMAYAGEANPCPSSHPVRLPQISVLLYYPGASSVAGWYLSSDRHNGANATPGSTLHADWWGGWNIEAMDLWTNGCIKAARNCSYGQTGTNRQLAPLNGRQTYEGPNVLPIPAGATPPA